MKGVLSGLTNIFLVNICHKLQARFPSAEFLGVFPRNSLPILPRRELKTNYWDSRSYFFICNTDTENLPGRHWVAVWVGPGPIGGSAGARVGEYFDPLGLLPLPEFSRWLTRVCGTAWSFTRFSVQHPATGHCGVWVLFYLYFKLSAGKKLLDFILFVLSRHSRGTASFHAAFLTLRYFQNRVLNPLKRKL